MPSLDSPAWPATGLGCPAPPRSHEAAVAVAAVAAATVPQPAPSQPSPAIPVATAQPTAPRYGPPPSCAPPPAVRAGWPARLARPRGAVPTRKDAAACCAGGSSCTSFPGTFWDDEYSYFVVNTTILSVADCCTLCVDTSECVRYQFLDFGSGSTICYLKNDTSLTEPLTALASSTAGTGACAAGLRAR